MISFLEWTLSACVTIPLVFSLLAVLAKTEVTSTVDLIEADLNRVEVECWRYLDTLSFEEREAHLARVGRAMLRYPQ